MYRTPCTPGGFGGTAHGARCLGVVARRQKNAWTRRWTRSKSFADRTSFERLLTGSQVLLCFSDGKVACGGGGGGGGRHTTIRSNDDATAEAQRCRPADAPTDRLPPFDRRRVYVGSVYAFVCARRSLIAFEVGDRPNLHTCVCAHKRPGTRTHTARRPRTAAACNSFNMFRNIYARPRVGVYAAVIVGPYGRCTFLFFCA